MKVVKFLNLMLKDLIGINNYIMKTTLLLLLLTFSLNIQSQTAKQNRLIASCCETKVGKCTGSASCSTCKNCTRCQYCSNGGSCGVCAGTTVNTFTSSTKKETSRSLSTNETVKKENVILGKNVSVINNAVNLREGPDTNYKIVDVLNKKDKLFVINKSDEWIKVMVLKTQEIGWVYAKYVK